jgi:hypothetical protein
VAALRALGRVRAERVSDARAAPSGAPFASFGAGVFAGFSAGAPCAAPAFGVAGLRDRRGAGAGASVGAAAAGALAALADVSAAVSELGLDVAGGVPVPSLVGVRAAAFTDRLPVVVAVGSVDALVAASR